MANEKFLRYIQEPDVHDGTVINARYLNNIFRALFNRRRVSVVVLTYDQRLFVIGFDKVRSAIINNVQGMMLYSLSEMKATHPLRRFVFVNHDEEDSDRQLEVVAQQFSSVEMTEEWVPKEAIEHLIKLYPQKPR